MAPIRRYQPEHEFSLELFFGAKYIVNDVIARLYIRSRMEDAVKLLRTKKFDSSIALAKHLAIYW